jgi:hypothetical protein
MPEQDDFGEFEVDFDSKYYHNASYLTLTELLSKVKSLSPQKQYVVCREFIDVLLDEIGELPERFILIDNNENPDTVIVGQDENADIFFIQQYYNDAINSIIDVQKKYAIVNTDEIRIVFAFDS